MKELAGRSQIEGKILHDNEAKTYSSLQRAKNRDTHKL